jgi:molybdopterin converting factor small subunit
MHFIISSESSSAIVLGKMAVTLKVLLFGPARDAMSGAPNVSVEVNNLPVLLADLRLQMAKQHPQLQFVLMNAIFALRNKLIPKSQENQELIEDIACEIILIPPVSGG